MRFAIQKIGAVFALFQLCASTAIADPLLDDAEWLRTMVFAAQRTNYSGVFVYQSGERVEMSRITHIFDKDGVHERLVGLNGPRREVVRNNDKIWLYVDDNKVRFEKRYAKSGFPALLPVQIQNLKENYRISQGEEDRVAEYHAHTILFQPKDNLRYTRKMWAHSESGLLLKAVVLDERGRLIEQYAFSQLSIGGNADHHWMIVPDETGATRLAEKINLAPLPIVSIESAPTGWQVDAVPSGFKKIIEIRRTMRDKKLPVVQIVYSDGLASISVFIEQASEANDPHLGLTSQGAVHINSRWVGDHLVTVVGEVPPRTVVGVADSVRYAGK